MRANRAPEFELFDATFPWLALASGTPADNRRDCLAQLRADHCRFKLVRDALDCTRMLPVESCTTFTLGIFSCRSFVSAPKPNSFQPTCLKKPLCELVEFVETQASKVNLS